MTNLPQHDEPWIFRTYSGHSSARTSNELYKKNLEKGQTGLSIAFDLPTQTGYDSDHILARGEVGKVGVPICHIDDMMQLFDGIPVENMNTSMTINATAPFLLALYIAVCERQGGNPSQLKGTTQNDILKEYLSRGTYAFPPKPSIKLTTDMIAYTYKHLPKWNPINICPYHLQEAGATPVQELSYGLANAICILDELKATGQIPDSEFETVVGRISFFLDSGIRFIEEMCKTRAFTAMWREICEKRYNVRDERNKLFRYGVQVNSLGLTEVQPENNLIRIVLELLGVTLSKSSRARAVQLPAWNEALGLPTAWDQQLALRMQQILAYETDLLEYADLFNGSVVIDSKVNQLIEEANAEMTHLESLGGVIKAIESGYIKSRLVDSNAKRIKLIEEGAQKVVGLNCYQETENPSLSASGSILKMNSDAESTQIERLKVFRTQRSESKIKTALDELRTTLKTGTNIMPVSIACAHAGVTVGEWSGVLREHYGEYRAQTGIGNVNVSSNTTETESVRKALIAKEKKIGRKPRILVGKPGLDGHSNGAEQVALKARDVGFEVIYQGIRLTPQEIVNTALQEDVDLIGLSILSGSHLTLVADVMKLLKANNMTNVSVVVGGIIPEDDKGILIKAGVKKVYTPKNFELNVIMNDLVEMILC